MTKRRIHRAHSSASSRLCNSCNVLPAVVMCSCTTPVSLLCTQCAPAHPASTGDHNLVALTSNQNVKLENAIGSACIVCGRNDASLVCCCQYPPVPVCQSCITTHVARPPYALHIPLPFQVRECISSQEFIETLRKRQVGKEQAKHILVANLAKVEEAEKVIRTQCKWLITAIKDEMEDALQELWKIREDLTHTIKAAMKEVEDHVYEENYAPSNYLVSTIWNFHMLPVESELSLFTYSVDAEAILKKMKEMIHLVVNTKEYRSTPGFIPIVNSTSLRKFYYQTEAISPPLTLSSAIKIDMTSAWIFLEDGKVFCCGRHNPASEAVYLIDASNGYVEQLESMLTHRCQQGMILFNQQVYVFGGLSKTYLKSCEVFGLTDGKWKELPDMKEARDGFNPCAHNDWIYVVGGSNATTAELFYPQTQAFTVLSVALPKADCSVSLIDGDDLVVLQRDAVYRWKLNSTEKSFRETRLNGSGAWSNATPVVLRNCVYILNCWTNAIGKCDLLEFTFQQASFTY